MILSFLAAAVLAQNYTPANPEWNQPVEPVKLASNLYYVGASDVSSFLFTSDQGHVLIDSGFRETVPLIKANIEKLGFKLKDVKYLLVTQAHYDHAAGIAELKRLTGAKLLLSAEDAKLAERGGKGDFAFQDNFAFEPVKADGIVKDGDELKLGKTIHMRAYITPGHTKGCTTWSAKVGDQTAVVVCGFTAPGYRLKGNPNYPNIVADFERTFATLEKMPCDIFLAAHASQFHLAEKRASGQFAKKGELAQEMSAARGRFRDQLAKQK
ncbi:CAU/MBL1b family subclass B3 metallo-beta-lactamase [Bryobacterales bacterium F-183]|nr:CAU/MBL1b family subclass B3 metallo-beta-lactamase [Bryobacterales bacterium F-183]